MTDHVAIIIGVLGVCACMLVLWRGRGAGRRADDQETDISTGLLTRRRFDQDVQAHAVRGDEPTAILLIDLDPPGSSPDDGRDEILQTVGAVVARLIRAGDVAYRYGGERFSVLLPGTDAAAAVLVAERIRRSVETAALPFGRRATVSAGVASGVADDVASIVGRADGALLVARRDGRNTIAIA